MTTTIEQDFEQLFRLHYQRLCSYAFTFLKDESGSEDIVQEVFIKVWEKEKMEIGVDKLKFYLFTAVHNNCLTLLQKNKNAHTKELEDEDGSDEMMIRLDPEDKGKDPKVLIAKAMEQLPPKCREVFMLSRVSGMSYRQIADSLGISIKTVENQMGKAIKVLRVFAAENGIYVVLFFLVLEKNMEPAIGVFLKIWF